MNSNSNPPPACRDMKSMDNKNNVKELVEDVAEVLNAYIYEKSDDAGLNGENVIILAPFAEVNDKLREIVSKYEGEIKA